MEKEYLQEIAGMIVGNFYESKVRAFVFGSTARLFKENIDPDERLLDEVFNSSDLDILFEVSSEVFQEYAENCYYVGLTHLGYPFNPASRYWRKNSLENTHWDAIAESFTIDDSLNREIYSMLNGKKLKIIVLPFGWEKSEDVLEVVNSQDSEFSENIQRDRILLFEK
jgi:hypothetical protein